MDRVLSTVKDRSWPNREAHGLRLSVSIGEMTLKFI
jgi:hypothetical protein